MLDDDLIQIGDMPQYRQAILALCVIAAVALTGQDTANNPLTEPGVVAYLLMQKMSEVASTNNQGIFQTIGVRKKALLHLAHGKVQE
ncbi:hypothetical protein D3C79_694350 [compost metagenome]